MTVQCIQCKNFSYQGAPRGISSDGGFGHCKFDPAYRFSSASYKHHCPKFDAAPGDVVERRIAWRDQQRAKFLKEIGACQNMTA